MNIEHIQTVGELKSSGYKPRSIKEEIRANLLKKLKQNDKTFSNIVGYEDSVIPDVTDRFLLMFYAARPGKYQDGEANDRFTG